jgi:hypothetical protein
VVHACHRRHALRRLLVHRQRIERADAADLHTMPSCAIRAKHTSMHLTAGEACMAGAGAVRKQHHQPPRLSSSSSPCADRAVRASAWHSSSATGRGEAEAPSPLPDRPAASCPRVIDQGRSCRAAPPRARAGHAAHE